MSHFKVFVRTHLLIGLCLAVAGCAGSGSKVLQDFGLQERPDDYVSGAQRVMERLPDVAKIEMTRLNAATRAGDVKYEKVDDVTGAYYKRVKVYEDFRPLDANHTGRSAAQGDTAYLGYIEYTYQFFESVRRPTRIEATSELANIPTGERDREIYRYKFNSGGNWTGGKGEPVKSE